ncbi:Cytochrome P450 [Macrophomina phaseolina MS6]|uniref:Cytochrome P450 n=1 Tax=Macrophomina phaseolina (strain MS6) TaxID=1126212 RepID=K2S013_MACPH|nr:Cytochrome P450 [Macrophomina phaseolina MS6]
MVAAVNRQGKSIAFRPLIIDFVKSSFQLDEQSHSINKKNLYDEEGKGLLTENHDLFYKLLPSGPALDELCRTIVDGVASKLNSLGPKETVDLNKFSKDLIGFLSARAFWGPENIMEKDTTLLSAFWDVEEAQKVLGLGTLSYLIAPKACFGRARLRTAMENYFEQGHWRSASTLIRERTMIHFARGYTAKMMARADMGLLLGTTPNAARTLVWFLSYLFANPDIVPEIRAELIDSGAIGLAADGKTATVDVHALRFSCPLYNSTLREVLRLVTPTSSMRIVREDLVLADQYLLRKGALCLVEGGLLHTKPSIWGEDAHAFNPRRFLKHANGELTDGSGKKVHPAALRIWGGGEVVCPGRFLATIEILGIAAPLIVGWNFEREGGGKFRVPKPRDDVVPVATYDPGEDVRASLIKREDWNHVSWQYKV